MTDRGSCPENSSCRGHERDTHIPAADPLPTTPENHYPVLDPGNRSRAFPAARQTARREAAPARSRANAERRQLWIPGGEQPRRESVASLSWPRKGKQGDTVSCRVLGTQYSVPVLHDAPCHPVQSLRWITFCRLPAESCSDRATATPE